MEKIIVNRIIELARVPVEDIQKASVQLDQICSFLKQLDVILPGAPGIENQDVLRLRLDEGGGVASVSDIVGNAPQQAFNMFRVPKSIE